MQRLLRMYSTKLQFLLNKSIRQTNYTNLIQEIPWNLKTRKGFVTFRQNAEFISIGECQHRVLEKFLKEGKDLDLKRSRVLVSNINIDWLIRDNCNFAEFSNVLKECSSQRIY